MKRNIILVVMSFVLLIMVGGCTRQERPTTVQSSKNEIVIYKNIAEYQKNAKLRYPERDDKFRYNIYDVCAIITQCFSSDKEIVIPDTIHGVPVIGISNGVFADNKNITKLVCGKNLLWIGAGCFSGCINLTSIEMSGSVNQIDERAFQGCERLKSIIVPAKVNEISYACFSGCKRMKKVVIESNTDPKIIRSNAFYGCENLTAIWIPDAVTTIESAFIGCSPIIYGVEASEAARYAANNLMDFIVTTQEGFNAVSRNYRPLEETNGTALNSIIKKAGGFDIQLIDVKKCYEIGDLIIDQNPESGRDEPDDVFVIMTFKVTNTTAFDKYFNAFDAQYYSRCADKEGDIVAYKKAPIAVPDGALTHGFLSGSISAFGSIEGAVVLKVSRQFNNISVTFDKAESNFVIV